MSGFPPDTPLDALPDEPRARAAEQLYRRALLDAGAAVKAFDGGAEYDLTAVVVARAVVGSIAEGLDVVPEIWHPFTLAYLRRRADWSTLGYPGVLP